MPIEDLTINGLYVLLSTRDSPPPANDFHWGLYLYTEERGGIKFHIRGAPGRWMADHASIQGVLKSISLVGLYHIANIPAEDVEFVVKIIRSHDNQ